MVAFRKVEVDVSTWLTAFRQLCVRLIFVVQMGKSLAKVAGREAVLSLAHIAIVKVSRPEFEDSHA